MFSICWPDFDQKTLSVRDTLENFRSPRWPITTTSSTWYYRNDLSELERERLNSRSHSYLQFMRLLAALECAEALETRVLVGLRRTQVRPQAFCSSTCLKLSKIKFVLLAASMVTGKVSADL